MNLIPCISKAYVMLSHRSWTTPFCRNNANCITQFLCPCVKYRKIVNPSGKGKVGFAQSGADTV